MEEAMHLTILVTGKAIMITSTVIFFGFLTLFFSDFKEITYFAIFLCITSISALLTDLFLVPVLIRKFIKE
jgi:predicted RND superfamily exporter protein